MPFQFLFLPQTTAGQEQDDLSSSYRQALRALKSGSPKGDSWLLIAGPFTGNQ
jgi:hypothetical protein